MTPAPHARSHAFPSPRAPALAGSLPGRSALASPLPAHPHHSLSPVCAQPFASAPPSPTRPDCQLPGPARMCGGVAVEALRRSRSLRDLAEPGRLPASPAGEGEARGVGHWALGRLGRPGAGGLARPGPFTASPPLPHPLAAALKSIRSVGDLRAALLDAQQLGRPSLDRCARVGHRAPATPAGFARSPGAWQAACMRLEPAPVWEAAGNTPPTDGAARSCPRQYAAAPSHTCAAPQLQAQPAQPGV